MRKVHWRYAIRSHVLLCHTISYHVKSLFFLFSKPYHRWIMLFFRFLKSDHAIEMYKIGRKWLLGGNNRYSFPYAIRETRRCTVSNTQVTVKTCGMYDTLYWFQYVYLLVHVVARLYIQNKNIHCKKYKWG